MPKKYIRDELSQLLGSDIPYMDHNETELASEKSPTKGVWWEKTVEYIFVKQFLPTTSLFSPLGGNAEKFFGDLFDLNPERKARLIEFKREKSSIADEVIKYYEKDKVPKGAKYEDAWRSIVGDPAPPGASGHWIIYGKQDNHQLDLHRLQYGESNQSLAEKLTESMDPGYVCPMELLRYMDKLGKARTRGGTWPNTLVVALVDNNTYALEPHQFITQKFDLQPEGQTSTVSYQHTPS
jgi:hypothetical protein